MFLQFIQYRFLLLQTCAPRYLGSDDSSDRWPSITDNVKKRRLIVTVGYWQTGAGWAAVPNTGNLFTFR